VIQAAGAIKAAKGPHVFWSGSDDKLIWRTAKNFAYNIGGSTIKMDLVRGEVYGVSPRCWDRLCRLKAKVADGTVYAILGKEVREQSTWKRVELPTLLKNGNVKKIIHVDPATREEVKDLKVAVAATDEHLRVP